MPRWILPLNIVLSLLAIGALALIAADLVSFKISGLYPRSGRASAVPAAPAAAAEELQSFAPILERSPT